MIIKNVSTRRNLNVDPWANHQRSLFFLLLFFFSLNNPIWRGEVEGGGGEISIVPFPREQHWQGVTRLDKTWRCLTASHSGIIGPQHFLSEVAKTSSFAEVPKKLSSQCCTFTNNSFFLSSLLSTEQLHGC